MRPQAALAHPYIPLQGSPLFQRAQGLAISRRARSATTPCGFLTGCGHVSRTTSTAFEAGAMVRRRTRELHHACDALVRTSEMRGQEQRASRFSLEEDAVFLASQHRKQIPRRVGSFRLEHEARLLGGPLDRRYRP